MAEHLPEFLSHHKFCGKSNVIVDKSCPVGVTWLDSGSEKSKDIVKNHRNIDSMQVEYLEILSF